MGKFISPLQLCAASCKAKVREDPFNWAIKTEPIFPPTLNPKRNQGITPQAKIILESIMIYLQKTVQKILYSKQKLETSKNNTLPAKKKTTNSWTPAGFYEVFFVYFFNYPSTSFCLFCFLFDAENIPSSQLKF